MSKSCSRSSLAASYHCIVVGCSGPICHTDAATYKVLCGHQVTLCIHKQYTLQWHRQAASARHQVTVSSTPSTSASQQAVHASILCGDTSWLCKAAGRCQQHPSPLRTCGAKSWWAVGAWGPTWPAGGCRGSRHWCGVQCTGVVQCDMVCGVTCCHRKCCVCGD
jgi:hypothetical protein